MWWEQGYTYSQQVRENIVDAALTVSGTSLTTPFVAYAEPTAPARIVKHFGGELPWYTWDILSFAGFVSVGVEDQYCNPISNETVKFAAPNVGAYCVPSGEDRLSALLVPVGSPCIGELPSYDTCKGTPGAGNQLSVTTSHLGASVQVFTGAVPNTDYPITATCDKATGTKSVTFSLHTDPFGNCTGGSTPSNELKLVSLHPADQYGNDISAGAVGDEVTLRAKMYFLKEGWTTGAPVTFRCGDTDVTCAAVVGNKQYETTTDLKEPSYVSFNNKKIETPDSNGIYTYKHPLEAGPNKIEIKGTGTISIKQLVPCNNCAIGDADYTDTASATMSVYGVAITVPQKLIVPVDEKGYSVKDVPLTYSIAPADYEAVTARVAISKVGETEPFVYIEGNTKGTDTVTLATGFKFTIDADYYAQIILNQGTGVEIRSELIPIEFKNYWVKVDDEPTQQSKRIRVEYRIIVRDPSVIQKLEFTIRNPKELDTSGNHIIVYSTDSDSNPLLTKNKGLNAFEWDGMDNTGTLTTPWEYTLEMKSITTYGQTVPITDIYDKAVIPIARVDNGVVFSRHSQKYKTTYTGEASADYKLGSFKDADGNYYFPGPIDGFYAKIKGEEHNIYIAGNQEIDNEAFLYHDLRGYEASQVKSSGARMVQRMLNLVLGVKGELGGIANYQKNSANVQPLYTPVPIDGWFGDAASTALRDFKETYMTGETDLKNEETILRKYDNLRPDADAGSVSSLHYQYITGADTMKALIEKSKTYDNMVTYNADPNDTNTLYGLLTVYATRNKPNDLTVEDFIAFAKGVAMQESIFYHATAQGMIHSSDEKKVTWAKGIYQITLDTWNSPNWKIYDTNNIEIAKLAERRYVEEYNLMGGISYLKNQYESMRKSYPSSNGWTLDSVQRMKMAAAAYSRGKGRIDGYISGNGITAIVFKTQYNNNIEELLTAIIEQEQVNLNQTSDTNQKAAIQERIDYIKEGRNYVQSIFTQQISGRTEKGWLGYFKENPTAGFDNNGFRNLPNYRVE